MFHRFPFLILISKNTSNIPSSLSISLSALKKKKKRKKKTKMHKFHSLSFFSKKLSSGPNIFRLARMSVSGCVSILFLFAPFP